MPIPSIVVYCDLQTSVAFLLLWQKIDMMNLLVKIHSIQFIISIGHHLVYNNVCLSTKNLTVINKLVQHESS